jgi:uncharacterized protein YkvS
MKLQITFKSGLNEVAKVKGVIHVSNAQLMKATQLENLIEELTGLRAHVEVMDESDNG